MKIKRYHNMDLLKILLMYFIVVCHIVGWGGIVLNTAPFTVKQEIFYFIYTFTGFAVNAYAIISGYFGMNSRSRFSGFGLLWLKAVWYGVLFTGIFLLIRPQSVGILDYLKAVFPVNAKAYWYLTAYFMLIVFKPILNAAVNVLSKREFCVILAVVLAFTAVPAMINVDRFSMNKGFSSWWLIVMYLIGCYIRKYGLFPKMKTLWLWLLLITAVLFDLFKRNVYDYLIMRTTGERAFFEDARNYSALTMVIAAVCMVLIFERIEIKSSRVIKAISLIASMSFSVYLIHVNHYVWKNLICDCFVFISEYNIFAGTMLIFLNGLLVFLLCIIIDIPREFIFKKFGIKEKLTSFENSCTKKLMLEKGEQK